MYARIKRIGRIVGGIGLGFVALFLIFGKSPPTTNNTTPQPPAIDGLVAPVPEPPSIDTDTIEPAAPTMPTPIEAYRVQVVPAISRLSDQMLDMGRTLQKPRLDDPVWLADMHKQFVDIHETINLALELEAPPEAAQFQTHWRKALKDLNLSLLSLQAGIDDDNDTALEAGGRRLNKVLAEWPKPNELPQ